MNDPFDRVPLLGGSIWSENPDSWRSRVKSYYDETAGKKGTKKKAPPRACVVSKSKKGVISFRIKRDPKFITEGEITAFATELGIAESDIRVLAEKRKIEIRKEETNATN